MQVTNCGEIVGYVAEKSAEKLQDGSGTIRKVVVVLGQFSAKPPLEFYLGERHFNDCPERGELVRIKYELEAKPKQGRMVTKPAIQLIEAVGEGGIAGSTESAGSGGLPKRRAA